MEQYIQHFRKDEQPFIEKVIDWKNEVTYRYSTKLTPFLDPREQFIVQSIIRSSDELSINSFGAFSNAERKRMLIYPSYFEVQKEDFQIIVFQVHYPSKFIQLRHQDILGALLSLGLSREKFGDIYVKNSDIQIALSKEIADYVLVNLKTIGKAKVQLEEIVDETNYIELDEVWNEQTIIVSSMRLDTILSTALNIARSKAQSLIKAGKVKVNFTVREENAYEMEQGDLLSVRGFGRMRIIAIEGRTNKDKIRLKLGKIM